MVTSNLGAVEAAFLAERILRDIADMKIQHPGSSFGFVTVSIGVSTFEHCPGQSHEQLINEADTALYRAKQAGRNCCVAYSG